MKKETATHYRKSIIALLISEKLPVADLPQTLDNFIVTLQGDKLTGVAGLEISGLYGLLRSLAVEKAFRNQGIANQLLSKIERLAISNQVTEIYLLTETASNYFIKKGFQHITRDEVPAEIQQTSLFSKICPQSAIVMKKQITNNNEC